MADKCPAVSVTIKGTAKDVLDLVRKEAKKDAEITGDEKSGKIVVKKVDVTGTYTVSGQKITFNMVDNTFFVDCKKINEMIVDYFKGK